MTSKTILYQVDLIPSDLSLFASFQSCFAFCINYSRRVVASLDGIIGSLIQTSLSMVCDSKSGTADIQAIIS